MKWTVEASHICKAYGPVRAVQDVNLSLKAGEAFGLLGANGAGKSTLLECIVGTKTPDSGSVSVLGMHPQNDRKRLFERVGVQFQQTNYQDKILVGELCRVTESLYKAPQPYAPLLAQFGLSGKEKSPVQELSGGERQRLFIVLALIPRPQVVILDELTTGLDARARRDVWKCLAALKAEGTTLLLISHFMDEVEALCDRVMILKGGKGVFEGTVQEAIAQSPCDGFESAYLWHTGEEASI